MNRRDFLKLSTVALGGILLPVRYLQESAPSLGKEEVQFALLTTPSLDVDVVINGRLFGSISGNIFLPFVNLLENGNIEDCLKQSCIVGEVGNPKDKEMPSASAEYLSSVPYALLPLLSHPITSIKNVQSEYSISGLVLPRQTITVPSDYFPKEISSAGSVLPNAGGIIGPYYWRVSLEKHFVGGCIKRDVWHAGAMVKYHATDQLIFNLHLCGWWEGSSPCFGAYESRSRWCKKVCINNPWTALYVLVLAAATLYLSYWIANAIALAIATPALGILTAIPGVPPPP